jgi:hypothetical protein
MKLHLEASWYVLKHMLLVINQLDILYQSDDVFFLKR